VGVTHRRQAEPGENRKTKAELERHDDILHDDRTAMPPCDAQLFPRNNRLSRNRRKNRTALRPGPAAQPLQPLMVSPCASRA
jgi:hypothetical protein